MASVGIFAIGLSVGAVPGSAQAAEPPSGVLNIELPLTDAADVASSADRVFVSGGAKSTTVVVTDRDGNPVGQLAKLPGPTDLVMSDDGHALYVALPNVNAIAAFDTDSLRETARYDTGDGECPSSLALTPGFLWFGYGCDQWGGEIGRIDLGTNPATVTTGVGKADFHDHPLLATAAWNPEVLLAGQPALSPASARAYALGPDGALTFLRQDDHTLGSNLRDVALSPTGERVYLACGSPASINEYSFSNLSVRRRAFPVEAYPNAVELSRDGGYVAAGVDGTYDPDVYLYTAAGLRLADFELGQPLIDRGLAWAPDAQRLYAVTADSHATPVRPATLHVLLSPVG